MSKLLLVGLLLFTAPRAHALATAASFDVSYGFMNLSLSSNTLLSRTLSSPSVIQIDYNVSMFDYKTVASLSFLQVMTSNLGNLPLTRIALGGAYHFIRVNGQRVILDSQVEGKIWGISPAVQLLFGLSVLSFKDPSIANTDFTASMIDMTPKFLLEIPLSPSFLMILGAAYTLNLTQGGAVQIGYAGSIFDLGFKLTTL